VIKKFSPHFALVFAAVAIFVGILSFQAQSSRGQSQKPKTGRVKPTVMVTPPNEENKTVTAPTSNENEKALAAPAVPSGLSPNAVLQNELIWTFGSKQQRGWYLYNLLIGRTLDTQSDADSHNFTEALAAWQRKMGLAPDGVLDEQTLMAMISHWQGSRLKDKSPATPEQLLTAPSSDFYDPSRLEELRQVERNTYAAYKQMVAAAIADPSLKLEHTSPTELAPNEKFLKIVSAFRSREYQEKLRRESPNAGSAGLAVNSPHFSGRALDVYVGGDPVDTKDANRALQVNTPAYQWLVHNAERFGFRPYFYEPWHWEYVK
jgi:zinc D-Ala-D-Ala carboxypeptidase